MAQQAIAALAGPTPSRSSTTVTMQCHSRQCIWCCSGGMPARHPCCGCCPLAASCTSDCLHQAVVRVHGHDSPERLQQRAHTSGKVLVHLPAAGERVRKVHLQGLQS